MFFMPNDARSLCSLQLMDRLQASLPGTNRFITQAINLLCAFSFPHSGVMRRLTEPFCQNAWTPHRCYLLRSQWELTQLTYVSLLNNKL